MFFVDLCRNMLLRMRILNLLIWYNSEIKLREYLVSEIESKIDKTIFNGHRKKRLPNNVNISFIDVEGEAVLLYLDEIGIQISVGSACA